MPSSSQAVTPHEKYQDYMKVFALLLGIVRDSGIVITESHLEDEDNHVEIISPNKEMKDGWVQVTLHQPNPRYTTSPTGFSLSIQDEFYNVSKNILIAYNIWGSLHWHIELEDDVNLEARDYTGPMPKVQENLYASELEAIAAIHECIRFYKALK